MVYATTGPAVIDGRIRRKANNALQMVFQDGPGDPFGTATQGGGDGRGKKLGVLFGFKNGGAGRHALELTDGTVVMVQSQEKAPTRITYGPDKPLATVDRGDTSTAVGPDGVELLRVLPDPDDAGPDVIRSLLVTPHGPIGQVDLIRRAPGWSAANTLNVLTAVDLQWWVDHPVTTLPIPFLGTRLWLTEPVSGILADALLGVCVDLAIGLRPYTSAMQGRPAAAPPGT